METDQQATKLLSLVSLLFFFFPELFAQEFNTHWIYAPQADSLSHIWFRRAFISDGEPRQATIVATTTGYFKLYVNECNVGTALYYPLRRDNDDLPVSISFDVTPYLRPDTNVVALVYSPPCPSVSNRQLSVTVYGTTADGSHFSHFSDGSWQCMPANSRMTHGGGEETDGTCHDNQWNAATIGNPALWMPASTFHEGNTLPLYLFDKGYRAMQVIRATSIEIEPSPDNDSLSLQMPYCPYGFPRITLRDAKRGEKIKIGDLSYVCNGKMDEQAFPVFCISPWRTLHISGDEHFRPGQITNVEIMETGIKWFPNY